MSQNHTTFLLERVVRVTDEILSFSCVGFFTDLVISCICKARSHHLTPDGNGVCADRGALQDSCHDLTAVDSSSSGCSLHGGILVDRIEASQRRLLRDKLFECSDRVSLRSVAAIDDRVEYVLA